MAGEAERARREVQKVTARALSRVDRQPWLAPAIVALLLAPTAITWAGARLLIRVEAGRAEHLRNDHASLFWANAQGAAAQETRTRIAPLFTTPTIGATAAHLGQVLPVEADLRVLHMEAGGVMFVTIAAPDPDRLREALRSDAVLGRLRETNQRDGGDGQVWISLRGPAR